MLITVNGIEYGQKEIDALVSEADAIVETFGIPGLESEIEAFEETMAAPSFWSRGDAPDVASAAGAAKRRLDTALSVRAKAGDVLEAASLADEDPEFAEMAADAIKSLEVAVASASDALLFSGEYDGADAIVTIHPGEGGLEAQDFARMLFQMYSAYAQAKKWKAEVLDFVPDELRGTERAVLQVSGDLAYGMLCHETGVHRLVRISPTDEKERRHTSFASVEVMPVLPESAKIELDERDISWDVYRSSGPGGQGVNTTDSAVRATHIPTGIVVTCQVERSQLQNKERARAMLRSKLWERQQEEERRKRDELAGEKSTSAWGHAIRHYVLYPYKQIKDDRTGEKYSNADAILAGDMEQMLMDLKRWAAGKR